MVQFLREWKSIFLILFVGVSCMNAFVQSVAAASEWPLGLADEYTMAWINISYRIRNGSLISERAQVKKNSGKFGRNGRIAPASGVVVHVTSKSKDGSLDHFACEPITNEIPKENWIALIKRGMCDFEVKLKHAIDKNAVAMVVYDREESDTLEDMKLSSSDTIPGVFTYKQRGERIGNLSDHGIRVEMNIVVGETCTRPYAGINRTSVLFVSISFIVLMIISLAWLIFYYVQRFRYLHAKDRLAQRLCNAAKKALAKIPIRTIRPTDKEIIGESECCAVCIEIYKVGEVLRTLPCRHEFHKACVDPWLLEHRTCPMCKMDILKHYGYIFTGSQESILQLDEEAGDSSESSVSSTVSTPEHPTSPSSPTDLHQFSSLDNIESLPETPIEHPSDVIPFSLHNPHGENSRKPSLVSLTVVATPNGCVTSITPMNAITSPVMSISSTNSDSLVRSSSGCESGSFSSPGEIFPGSRRNSMSLISNSTSNDSCSSCQSPTACDEERYCRCHGNDSKFKGNQTCCHQVSKQSEDYDCCQTLLSPSSSAEAVVSSSSENFPTTVTGASGDSRRNSRSSVDSLSMKSCLFEGIFGESDCDENSPESSGIVISSSSVEAQHRDERKEEVV